MTPGVDPLDKVFDREAAVIVARQHPRFAFVRHALNLPEKGNAEVTDKSVGDAPRTTEDWRE
jgi:hypothetical protein